MGDDDWNARERPQQRGPQIRPELVGVQDVDPLPAHEHHELSPRPQVEGISPLKADEPDPVPGEILERSRSGRPRLELGAPARRAETSVEALGRQPLGDLDREPLGPPERTDPVDQGQVAKLSSFTVPLIPRSYSANQMASRARLAASTSSFARTGTAGAGSDASPIDPRVVKLRFTRTTRDRPTRLTCAEGGMPGRARRRPHPEPPVRVDLRAGDALPAAVSRETLDDRPMRAEPAPDNLAREHQRPGGALGPAGGESHLRLVRVAAAGGGPSGGGPSGRRSAQDACTGASTLEGEIARGAIDVERVRDDVVGGAETAALADVPLLAAGDAVVADDVAGADRLAGVVVGLDVVADLGVGDQVVLDHVVVGGRCRRRRRR